MRSLYPVLAFLPVVTLGCSKDKPAPMQTATTTSSAAIMTTSQPPLRPGETLMGALAREAANRPHNKPSAEDFFAALGKAGVSTGDLKQSMGATYNAAYCNGGYTTNGALALNVCEYATEADAVAGQAYAKTMFPAMTNRTILAHGASTLTIIQLHQDDAAKDLEKKVTSVFSAT
jgi:hypothetical protein